MTITLANKAPRTYKGRIELYTSTKSGLWHWRCRAHNGRILASGEGFSSQAKALHSLAVLKNIVANAPIIPATFLSENHNGT